MPAREHPFMASSSLPASLDRLRLGLLAGRTSKRLTSNRWMRISDSVQTAPEVTDPEDHVVYPELTAMFDTMIRQLPKGSRPQSLNGAFMDSSSLQFSRPPSRAESMQSRVKDVGLVVRRMRRMTSGWFRVLDWIP
ncbi:hypothetical protein NM208_g16743 [Fusarium decemcellulare]|uniref:Uncharacterized protein n=1 Tax=Fusarium decemcellulare TaxID=57161 RepID=A0ACC1R9D0_9HYPO|nr:hypothetical protein NM208_g16743 [Fusarium decemcellulare]